VLFAPPLTLTAGAIAADDEPVPDAVLLPVHAANITTPEVPPLPEPESEGVLLAEAFPGVPVEDRR